MPEDRKAAGILPKPGLPQWPPGLGLPVVVQGWRTPPNGLEICQGDHVNDPKSTISAAPGAARQVMSETGDRAWIEMTGHTMFPVLRPGDRLLIALDNAGLQPGDIAVYRRRGVLVAHRLLCAGRRLDGPCWLIQGDNANKADAPVGDDEIVGRAVAVERDGDQWSLMAPGWRLLGRWMASLTLAGSNRRRRLLRSVMARLPL